ncbi:T9SS type A sorting domain-containing protein [Flavobacteriaceae bacterium]|nr:T9SS type A sorting domain-containing protein [Flavobacteriaceae bacterium]
MKKITLAIIFAACFSGYSQTTAIPDPNFEQALIDLAIDTGVVNGLISTADAAAVTGTLDVRGKSISNLTGIEAFTSITTLVIKDNALTSLDLSALTQLVILEAAGNALTSVNVSGLTSLERLIVQQNALTSIDLTGLTNLDYLYLGENNITTLDVSDSPNIRRLYVNQNPNLGDFDVSNVASLERFRLYGTAVTSLSIDLVNHLSLDHIYAFDCPNLATVDITNSGGTPVLKIVRFYNTAVASLDLSNVTSLTEVQIQDNASLEEVNIKNGNNAALITYDSTTTPNLTCIQVDDVADSTARWTSIDAANMFSLDCFLSIDDLNVFNYSFYPNSAENIVTLDLDRDATYEVTNINGQLLTKGKLTEGNNTIDVSEFTTGLHFINIRDNMGAYLSIKLVKK